MLLIMPREAFENMVIQSDPVGGSISNVLVSRSVMGVERSRQMANNAMCLSHASKERLQLNSRVSLHNTVSTATSAAGLRDLHNVHVWLS